nr:uncharacterized protein LOC100179582 [Ciona intestinalis]|eukprot:XP_002124922.3 uncharacterized protein LOC100179582 [Ciona intestinalis]
MESVVTLNNGVKMPMVGLGTFQIKSEDIFHQTLDSALGCGYRLIDTAAVYKNEHLITSCLPELLEKYGLKREDVFVTTKLGPKDLSEEMVEGAVEASLKKMGLDYVDLYLIHWPGRQGVKGGDGVNVCCRRGVWKRIEEIYLKSGKIKSIGISNYLLKHLVEMSEYWTVVPAVLQNEFHPDYVDYDVIKFCKDNGIHFQSYSSLGQARLVDDPRFIEIAEKYRKTVAQVLLKWSLQHGCSVIPKSTQKSHIEENAKIFDFEISDEDLEIIGKVGTNTKYAWDPQHVV